MLFLLCRIIMVSAINNAVNEINLTISSTAISPDGNLSNMFINENVESVLLMFGKNHVIMKNPIVSIPAIIWFSVMLDANIPNEIYAMLSNKNPNNVTNAVCICGVPKKLSIM